MEARSLAGDDSHDDDDEDEDERENAVIAASYLVVVKAVAETETETETETGLQGEGYADGRWGAGLLGWGVRVVRGEGVVLPGEGEGEEEFVLFVGEW